MAELRPGLYEALITEELQHDLRHVDEDLRMASGLEAADAANGFAWHVSHVIERAVAGLSEKQRVEIGGRVARQVLEHVAELTGGSPEDLPTEPFSVLRGVYQRRPPDSEPDSLAQPLIPLLDTTLLTNAPGEPTL